LRNKKRPLSATLIWNLVVEKTEPGSNLNSLKADIEGLYWMLQGWAMKD
jgi:hypothetical protein